MIMRVRRAIRVLRLLLAALLVGGCASVTPRGHLELGPVATDDRSLEGYDRLRVAGPLVETQTAVDGRAYRGVRPFYSDILDPSRDRRLREYVWPLGIIKDLGRETHWRFLTGYGHDFDNTDPESRYRGMIFPFFFWGRDVHDEDYFACFPLGGKLHEFLGRDRIRFVLFPLYMHSVVDEVETTDILWPLISRTSGDNMDRFRVFPFYGYSEQRDDWRKQFVLWPLWTHARYHYPCSHGTAWVLWPLMGRVDLSDQQGWMALPPFFRYSRSEKRTELRCPWPFVQYASGDVDQLYLWPLWGRKSRPNVDYHFALWPIGHHTRVRRPDDELHRLMILPFWYQEKHMAIPESGEPEEVTGRYTKLWPLGSYQRENDARQFRAPALWPLRETGPIERNFAPLWTLYKHTRIDDSVESELLWGLYRYRRDGDEGRTISLFPLFNTSRSVAAGGTRQWSILLGLLGHERSAYTDRWRALWFLNWSAMPTPRESGAHD